MDKKKTVDGWGLPTIKYELAADRDTAVKVFCELCHNYYSNRKGGYMLLDQKGLSGVICKNIKVIPEYVFHFINFPLLLPI